MKSNSKIIQKHLLLILTAGLIVSAFSTIGYLFYQKNQLKIQGGQLQRELSATHEQFNASRQYLEGVVSSLESELGNTKNERDGLDSALRDEKAKVGVIEEQIEDITGTVGKLDKLSKIDPELLQKYSKVFFLNENYIPERLVKIDDENAYNEDKDFYLHFEVLPFFEDMIEDAKDDDINLWVVSAFRSFDEQADLKGQYTVAYGSGANTFSADQGYSEHQLGATIDFTTNGINGGLTGFENTKAYTWLTKNAHRYGFTLSYPEKNGFYIFEPWHWRFVGEELARDLRNDNQNFYDLDQRDIDAYLINLFD